MKWRSWFSRANKNEKKRRREEVCVVGMESDTRTETGTNILFSVLHNFGYCTVPRTIYIQRSWYDFMPSQTDRYVILQHKCLMQTHTMNEWQIHAYTWIEIGPYGDT